MAAPVGGSGAVPHCLDGVPRAASAWGAATGVGSGDAAGAAPHRASSAAFPAASDQPLPLCGCLQAIVGRAVAMGAAGLPVRRGMLVCRGAPEAVGPIPSFASAGLRLCTVKSVASNQQSALVVYVDPATGKARSERVDADDLRIIVRLYDRDAEEVASSSDDDGSSSRSGGGLRAAVDAALGAAEFASAVYIARRLLLALLLTAPVLSTGCLLADVAPGQAATAVLPADSAVMLIKLVVGAEGLLDTLTSSAPADEGAEQQQLADIGGEQQQAPSSAGPIDARVARDAAVTQTPPRPFNAVSAPEGGSPAPPLPPRPATAAAAARERAPTDTGASVDGGGRRGAGGASATPLVAAVDAVVRVLVGTGGSSSNTAAWSALVRECASSIVSSTRPPPPPTAATAQIAETLHPYAPSCAYRGSIRVDGSKGLTVTFDRQCALAPGAKLFLGAGNASAGAAGIRELPRIVGPAPPGSPAWVPVSCIGADTLYYYFSSPSGSTLRRGTQPDPSSWGWRIAVSPLRGLQWLNEAQACTEPSLNFGLWLMALLTDAAAALVSASGDGMPIASAASDSLMRELQTPAIYNALARYLQVSGHRPRWCGLGDASPPSPLSVLSHADPRGSAQRRCRKRAHSTSCAARAATLASCCSVGSRHARRSPSHLRHCLGSMRCRGGLG
jgi:hypothetical protein